MFSNVMSSIIFYAIPSAVLVFFGISLFLYCYARHRNKRHPGSYSTQSMKTRLILLVVSSVISAILSLIVIGYTLLLMLVSLSAIAFM